MIGIAGGLLAALAYHIFRLPFVFAKEWGISSVVPPMKLFKVFPRFGAMILGQPTEQAHYSLAAQVLGVALPLEQRRNLRGDVRCHARQPNRAQVGLGGTDGFGP